MKRVKQNHNKQGTNQRIGYHAKGSNNVKIGGTTFQQSVMAKTPKKLSKIPIQTRTTVKFNKIDHLKCASKPRRIQPWSDFPLWNEWPLDAKVPDYRSSAWPPDSLYFTRGKLCQSLHAQRKEFDLSDPKGHRSAFQMSDYTALHDPLTQKYFRSPDVLRQLRNNKLISDKNEVICDAKNYNQFRTYLASLQNEMVEQKLKNSDELHNITLEMQRASHTHAEEYQITLPIDKLANVRKMQEDNSFKRIMQIEKSIHQWEDRICAMEQRKRLHMLESAERQDANNYQSWYIRHKYKTDNIQRSKNLVANVLRDEIRRKEAISGRLLQQNGLPDQQRTKKFIAQKCRDGRILELEETMKDRRQIQKEDWIKKYEEHIQFKEKNQERVLAKRKALEERVKFLRRKYYDLWRAIVIRHRERPNSVHYTAWNIERDIKKTVIFLQEATGYVPQNFFTSLLQNRKDVTNWADKKRSEVALRRSQQAKPFNEDNGETDE